MRLLISSMTPNVACPPLNVVIPRVKPRGEEPAHRWSKAGETAAQPGPHATVGCAWDRGGC